MKTRQLFFTLITLLFLFTFQKTMAGPGDTIHVQTFTFGSPQDGWFVFPSDTVRIEKIIMNYKLKCNPAQSPNCGEWDYLTYTYLYEHTGMLDSTLLSAHSYIVDGASPDSLKFMKQPSWQYFPVFNTNIVHTDTLSFDSAIVGTGALQSPYPFNTYNPVSRTQYLWRVTELLSSGLHTGDISAMRFNIQSTGSNIHQLHIRIKLTTQDSLTNSNYQNTGFTEVFNNSFSFPSSGWNTIYFTNPFYWDGVSNLIIEISYDNISSGISNLVYAENTSFGSCVSSSDNDKSLFFKGVDYVEVPKQAFASVDSFLTITFWQYGNPAFQPQDQCTFEGTDSLGNRVINAHIPWSNANVYWDAGNVGGSYDRINKLSQQSDYEGNWRHWTFTKNTVTGKMNIYLNGHLWHTGTGMTRLMKNIKQFKLGSAANGTMNYDGYIDDFTIWNKDLDTTTIQQWMNKDIDPSHPDYAHLMAYYKFNDNSFISAADSSGNNRPGTLFGPPVYTNIAAKELFKNYSASNLRPNVVFEQGIYLSHIDTLITTDSTQLQPMQIVFFNDSLHPLVASDTMTVWPVYYNNYVYDSHGIATDSSLVAADSSIFLRHFPYYCAPFEVINRFEIGRFITPYGNGLSLGNGFTWKYDVSDYRTLLKDSVHLSAGNWQELLDLSFDMIEGIPPRDPISVKNIWNGTYGYGANTENELTEKKVLITPNATNTRIKMRPTGHGFGGNQNCSEFCPKNHKITVDGIQRFSKLVWKPDCGLNPVYPQGGTWVYARSNWCPGDIVPTFDFELSPYVTPGDSSILDYNIDPYTWNGQGSWPYFQIETQLVSYSAPNFTIDAAIADIKSPSKDDIYKRKNPICNNPVVVIRNTGSDTLKSVDITYGIQGATPSTYHWTGNLAFTDTANVKLGQYSWQGTSSIFYATVSNPNNTTDQYQYNNSKSTTYNYTPEYVSTLVFEFKSNLYPGENEYTLTDDLGNVLLSRNSFDQNTIYKDTLTLTSGCYFFRLTDNDDDGLSFWANSDGSGYMRIKKLTGQIVKSFPVDFGSELFQYFTVGYNLPVEDEEMNYFVNIYPNPSNGMITCDMIMPTTDDVELNVFNQIGSKVFERKMSSVEAEHFRFDLSSNPSGIYIVNIKTAKKTITKKLMLMK